MQEDEECESGKCRRIGRMECVRTQSAGEQSA